MWHIWSHIQLHFDRVSSQVVSGQHQIIFNSVSVNMVVVTEFDFPLLHCLPQSMNLGFSPLPCAISKLILHRYQEGLQIVDVRYQSIISHTNQDKSGYATTPQTQWLNTIYFSKLQTQPQVWLTFLQVEAQYTRWFLLLTLLSSQRSSLSVP